MKCPNCNNEIDDKSIFCTYCGVKVEKDDSNEITETVSDSNETVKHTDAKLFVYNCSNINNKIVDSLDF